MERDNRKILEIIISNPAINGKELENIFDLSRRQLGYRISKINIWLEKEGFNKLERTPQGRFILSKKVIEFFKGKSTALSTYSVDNMSIEKRRYLLMLMLFSDTNAVSLNDFSIELKVSKNTVIHDMNAIKEDLALLNLSIHYSRKTGYNIIGDEENIRQLLVKLIESKDVYELDDVSLLKAFDVSYKEFTKMIYCLEEVETFLNHRFVDQHHKTIPIFLAVIKKRIENHHIVPKLLIQYSDLRNTKEFQATEILSEAFNNIPPQEKLYLTLHLLTKSFEWLDLNPKSDLPLLERAINRFIFNFEKLTCIEIENFNKLHYQLLQHLKPAFYRIKYKLNDSDSLKDPLKGNYKELQYLVKQASEPLSEFFKTPIPANELAYLTMIIGGSLRNQDNNFDGKLKAVIVCNQGTSVSQMMLLELRDLFPELIFLDALSLRSFESYNLDYDVVFSPMPVLTHKKNFITKGVLTHLEQRQLRKEVLKFIKNDEVNTNEELEKIIEIVQRNTEIKNMNQLKEDLTEYVEWNVWNPTINTHVKNSECNLCDFLSARHIRREYSVSSLQEGIMLAAEPLIMSKAIKKEYVKRMQESFDPTYMIIMNNIAIPHATYDDDVYKTSMSMLVLKEPIVLNEHTYIHVIVPIAAIDKITHIRSLLQLRDLAQNNDAIKRIIKARKKLDIIEVINHFSNLDEPKGGN
ncbi:PTS system mannitol (Cryptic)-specific transporter subunit IIA [Staphylococcus agnetis]|uniref:BglG family transcription antiterminator n=1 Tax=Staphylococcus agnetis TaxID=985762 RepID=UPI000DFDE6B8|nr:BglG family transcription antiterminator [Staphylococcus agnetis]SUK04755.1 PTS system mannitol (Cryptic)-specific transporter subunit IIA [Staphylococcus agnetis]